MIYGVCGASGTGKSTLCRSVSESLSIPFIETSITNMARKAGFGAVSRLNLKDRLTLQLSLLKQFEELVDKIRGPAILDRTPIDLVGYLMGEVGMHSHEDLPIEYLEEIDEYVTQCQFMTAQRFDRLFLTSILDEYEEVETRPSYNPAYQRHVQTILAGTILTANFDLNVTVLATNDFQSRLEIVNEAITKRLDEIDMHKRKTRWIN